MPDATFAGPDLTTFCRLGELGLEVLGQRLDRAKGRDLMTKPIEAVSKGVPAAMSEVTTLGMTLKKRENDVLAYFDRPGASNGPTEAISCPARAPTRLRPRLPQPHQLHRQITTRGRRLDLDDTQL